MIKIRKLTLKDHHMVFDIFSLSINTQFPEFPKDTRAAIISSKKFWNKTNYKKRLQNKNLLILGAFFHQKLVGLLDLQMPFAGVSEADWLIVHPDHQKKRVGSALIEKCENILLKKGAHLLYLYSPSRNIQFYRKLGFTEVGIFKKGWFGLDDHVLTKLIQEPREENFLR